MKQLVPVLFATSAFLLAACGGGGGGGITPPGGGGGSPTPTPRPTPTPTPGTTVAQGTLVDDPSGTPLAGVTVRVDPWSAYPTPGPTPTPIAVTTTDSSGHFVVSEPNGTYLLVIGSDAVNTPPPGWSTPAPNATDTPIPGASGWRPTIHDRIVLTGGGTVASPLPLIAPTMPPQPLYTPPAAEIGGKYRLATLDALTEAPCILAWNDMRQTKSLASAVSDEWGLENARAVVYVGMQPNGAGQVVHMINSGNDIVSGSGNCDAGIVQPALSGNAAAWATSRGALWFGGTYARFMNNTQGYGAAVFPIDPRVFTDPNGLVWP